MRHLDPVSIVFLFFALMIIVLIASVCAGMAFADWWIRRYKHRDVERRIRAARDQASAREGGHQDFY